MRGLKNRDIRVAASKERQVLKAAAVHDWTLDEMNDVVKAIAEEEDCRIIADMVGVDYETRGWQRAPNDTPLGFIRWPVGWFDAQAPVESLTTTPCFVEQDEWNRRWWRPLTPAETVALVVEEDM